MIDQCGLPRKGARECKNSRIGFPLSRLSLMAVTGSAAAVRQGLRGRSPEVLRGDIVRAHSLDRCALGLTDAHKAVRLSAPRSTAIVYPGTPTQTVWAAAVNGVLRSARSFSRIFRRKSTGGASVMARHFVRARKIRHDLGGPWSPAWLEELLHGGFGTRPRRSP